MPSRPKTKSKKGCWTCKARKVQCDEGMPTCRRCNLAGRECEGYGMRLSWPRDNDEKRAIRMVLPVAIERTLPRYKGRGPFINTTSQDVELYYHLTLPGFTRPPRSSLLSPKLWKQPQSEIKHGELLQYFHGAAHRSLATFSPTTSQIRDVIMHMVFAHDTVSRHALFYALLAFSSLHRSGLHHQTILFKVAALKALAASTKEAAQGSTEAAQHVAACMILCAFEILLPSENSGEWLWHIRGAMEVVQRSRLEVQSNSDDRSGLISWVYYHEALSRFTLYHWRHKYLATNAIDTGLDAAPLITKYSSLMDIKMVPPPNSPPYAVLSVLSEICDVLLNPNDPRSQEAEYQDRLRALEWKVDNLPPSTSPPPTSAAAAADQASADLDFTSQLYRVATRIYLARASRGVISSPTFTSTSTSTSPSSEEAVTSLVESMFAGPVRDCYCQHFFPLLIIACEARTEAQRAAILNLIDRTDGKGYGRSMAVFRTQVQAFWVQQDLHADGELVLNYLGLMRAVVSSDRALPSYV